MPTEGASRDPERERKNPHRELDVGDPGPNVTCRACDDSGPRLVVAGRVQSFMAIDVMTTHERLVLERVLDLYGRRFEQCPLALSIRSVCHSKSSMAAASSL